MKEENEKVNELNSRNELLTKEINELNQNKTITDDTVLTLKNDQNMYMSKIKEYENELNECKNKLKCALEENLSIQSDFDNYKLMTDEQLQRKEQELNDAKQEIDIKEKLIMELNKGKKDTEENEEENNITQTLLEQYNANMRKQRIKCNSNRMFRTFSTGSLINNILTPVVNSGLKIPEKYMDIYKNSCNEGQLSQEDKQKLSERINKETEKIKEEENENEENEIKKDKEEEHNIHKTFSELELIQGDSFCFHSHFNANKSVLLPHKKSSSTNIKNNNKQNLSNRNIQNTTNNTGNAEINGTLNKLNNTFNDETSNIINKVQKTNNKKISENLKEMLSRIQQRKNELLEYKKSVNDKLEKMGIKIRQNY